jgi:hypothetical protein
LPGKRVRLVDASVVCEPGATGSTWRLHYALDLSNLCCDEVHVSDVKQGESLTHYEVKFPPFDGHFPTKKESPKNGKKQTAVFGTI